MATSNVMKSCASKLTKAEKKALRKQTRLVNSLRRHNADLASISEIPTRHLMIGNGGLMCGIQRSQLVSLFQKFGNIERILMFPGRSFSFLSFEYVNESMKAMKALHGRVLDCPSEFPRPEVTFYLSFLASVPDDVSIENQAKPSGLVLVEDFVNDAEEGELIKALGWGSDSCDSEYQGTGISLQCTAIHLVVNSFTHPLPSPSTPQVWPRVAWQAAPKIYSVHHTCMFTVEWIYDKLRTFRLKLARQTQSSNSKTVETAVKQHAS